LGKYKNKRKAEAPPTIMKVKELMEFENEITDWALNYIYESTKDIRDLISLVNENLTVKRGTDGRVESDTTLSKEDILVLVVKLPALCVFLQTQLSEQSVGHATISCILERDITEKILEYGEAPHGKKGDSSERKRKAELSEHERVLASTVQKQITRALTDYIERADKVYEGLKKAVDAMNREAWYDGKIR
jgi:hypothetical protein